MKIFLSKGSIILAVALACLLAGPTLAQENEDREAIQASLRALHQHQADLAELAEERAESDKVVQLANTLARDHAILDEWLAEASGNSDTQHDEHALHDRESFEALRELEGGAFDETFLSYQKELHIAAIEYLEQNRPQVDEQLGEFSNHLLVNHETLLVNSELIDSLL
ncbi:DUF4142 domain-containing protein [Billgrantia diversa]|uniref:DUF4142 domain-containing protein n=1 Tax=Halomonas sp. MCCC 1A13316 TaxID=2733487 RepID=UPI0018A4E76A|nr:DUF4142 domain-containing protein [Halomonas sp. MCCC 1A13316]QOR40386.1 DUF4142 domain-containing protein [Halomonas sp. MCCC 1A13316]